MDVNGKKLNAETERSIDEILLSYAETAMTFQLGFNSSFKERIIDPIKFTNGI